MIKFNLSTRNTKDSIAWQFPETMKLLVTKMDEREQKGVGRRKKNEDFGN